MSQFKTGIVLFSRALLSALACACASAAYSATQTYQDANLLDTWNTSDFNWDAGAATWTNDNDAVFGGAGETVTVGTVSAHNILFGSPGYTLSGGTITFTGSSPTLTTDSDASISSTLSGAAGLVKAGAGTLILSGGNDYTGGTTLNAGTLTAANISALGGAGTALTFNGGTLRLATDSAVSSKNVTLGGNVAITLDRETSGVGFTTTFGDLTTTSGSRTLTVTKGANVTDAATLVFSGTLSSHNQTTTFDVGSGATVRHTGGMLAGAQTVSLVKNGAGTLILGDYGNWDGGGATLLNNGTLELRGVMGDSGNFRNLTAAAATTLRLVNDNSTNFYSGLSVNGSMNIVLDRLTAGVGLTHSLGRLDVNDTYTLNVSKGANVTSGTATLNFTGFPNFGAAGKTAGFNVDAGVAVNITGSLTGTQAFARLEKSGAGTLILSGNNNYWDPSAPNTGLVTVSGGTLDLSSQYAMGDGTTGVNSIALSMAGGTTLRLGTDTMLGNYANTTLTGDGVTILADRATVGAGLANTFNNLTTNGAYTLNVQGGANVTSGTTQVNFAAGTLGGNTTLNVTNPTSGATVLNFNGAVGGAYSVTKTGSGTVVFATNPTFTGDAIVNGGTMSSTNAAAWTVPHNIVISGGTYNMGGGNRQVNMGATPKTISFGAAGGTLNLNNANFYPSTTVGQTLVISTAGGSAPEAQIIGSGGINTDNDTVNFNLARGAGVNDLVMSGPLWNNGTVQKNGAGILSLTAANTHTGNVTVNAGTLKVTGTGRLYTSAHSGAVVTVQTGGVLELDTWFYGGATQSLGMLASGAAQIVLNNGTIRMNGTTTYGRGVTVNAGGATLEATTAANWTIDTVSENVNWVYNGNPSLTFTGAGTGTFQKVFSGTGALTKGGSGTWNFSGANTYSGATTISAGTMAITGGGTLGNGSYAGNIGNAGTLLVDSTANQTLSGIISGVGTLIKSNSGTLTISTNPTYTGDTTVNAGTLSLTSGTGWTVPHNILINGGTYNLGGGGRPVNMGAVPKTISFGASGGTFNVNTANFYPSAAGAQTLVISTAGGSAPQANFIGSAGINTDNDTVNFNIARGAGASDLVMTGSLWNGGTVLKSGNGILTLTGVSTHTGPTTISAGTYELAGAGQLNSGAYAGNITNDATLLINSTAAQRLSGTLTGAGSLVKNNTGVLTLSTPKTYTGATTVNGGVVTVDGTGTLSGTSGLTVATGAIFNYLPTTVGSTLTLGMGSTLRLDSDSTVGLNWNNDPTTPTASKIAALGAAAIGAGVKVNMVGSFTSGTAYTILQALSGLDTGSYIAINNTDYTAAFTLSPTSVMITPTSTTALTDAYWLGGTSGYESTLGVASNWTTDGAGTVSPVAPGATANVYFSDVSAAAGNQVNMTLGANMALNSITVNGTSGTPANTNPVSLSAAGGHTLTLGSGAGAGITLNTGAGAVTLSPAIALGFAQTWTNHSSNDMAVTGGISGTPGITKEGTGTVVLTGANTYSGGTTINNGTWQIGNGTVNGTVNGTYSVASGATLQLSYNTAGAVAPTWANISGAGTLDLRTAKSFDTAWGTPTLPAGFTGTVQIGGGRVVASGSGNQGFGGATDIVVLNGGHLGAWQGGTITQNLTLAGTGYGEAGYQSAIRLGNTGLTTTLAGTVTLSDSATIAASGGTGVLNGVVSGAVTSTLTIGTSSQGGTVVLNTTNTYAGPTVINYGTLQIGNGGTTGSLGTHTGAITNNATLAFNRSDSVALDNVVTGTGGVANYGTGSLTINGTQTYTGDTTVRQGTVNLPSGTLNGTSRIVVGATGGAGTPVFNLNGGTIIAGTAGTGNAIYLGATTSFPGAMNVSSGTFSTTSTAAFITVGDNAVGTYTQTGGTVSAGAVSGQLWVANNPGGTGSVFSISGGTFNAPGTSVLGVRGSYNFTVSGTGAVNMGTLQLGHPSGTNGGGRVIDLNGGVLALANGINYQNGTAVVNLNGGTLRAAASTANFWNNSANVTATLGAGGGGIDSNSFDITLNQSLSGAGPLTKTGAGILTLSGSHPYTGDTAVNAGTLHLTGTLTGGGAVTVNGSATLTQDATGAISGASTFTHDSSGTSILAGNNTYTGTTTVSQGTLLISGSTRGDGFIHVSAGATLGGEGSGGGTTLVNEAILSPGTADGNESNAFTLSSLVMSENSVYRFEPGNPATTYYTNPDDSFYTDHVTISGALTLNGRLLVTKRPDPDTTSFDPLGAIAEDIWLVATYTGAFDNQTLEIDPASAPLSAGLVYRINTTAKAGYIYLEVVVPEAGTGALLALGLGLLLRRRFR